MKLGWIVTGALVVMCACGGPGTGAPEVVDGVSEPDLRPEVVPELVLLDGGVDVQDVMPDVVEVVEVIEIIPDLPPLPLPIAEILQPLDGKVLNVALSAHFVGQVSDPLEPVENLSVIFVSSIDGQLFQGTPDTNGVVEFDYLGFTPGPQMVTMTVTNQAGLAASESVNIVMNIPPVGPTVTIENQSPGTNDVLHAVVVGEASDPEGAEVEVLIDWFNEGVPVNSLDGLVDVPPELTSKGETWSVVVRAFDGHSYGFAEQDKVTVENSPPTVSVVTIDPLAGDKKTEFNCLAQGAQDPDGDDVKLTYGWLVNDALFPGSDEPTLAGGLLTKGDELRCQVTALDEWLAGEPAVSDPVVIGNAPPEGGTAVLSPTLGPVDMEFTCAPEGAVDPDGKNVGYKIAWLVDGQPIAGANQFIYVPLAQHKGDVLRCRATPTDGEDYGDPFDSNAAILVNSPPQVSGVMVIPAQPGPQEDLACSGATSDLDGDDVVLTATWTVDGNPLDGQLDTTLKAGLAPAGAEVTCALTPNDGEIDGVEVAAENTVTVGF